MTKINITNFFVMSVLILSATSMIQNNAFAAPTLGSASNFAVLGGTTVTNTGATVIIGDLGVSSPGVACTGIVGCTTTGLGTVSGTIHVGDPAANDAHADAATAYGALVGATCTTNEPAVADIGGQTLTPGVYCFPSSAAITGTLTLDGDGVYIFKIGSTLVTAAANSEVVLTNGATANNVFWAVGSSATLGTDSVLKGTVIAYTSITSTAGATVDGRLLAINGAVTLDTNQITVVGAGTGGNGNGNGGHDDDDECKDGHDHHDHDDDGHDNNGHGKGGHDKDKHDKDSDKKKSGKN
jgi:hypothetical protein